MRARTHRLHLQYNGENRHSPRHAAITGKDAAVWIVTMDHTTPLDLCPTRWYHRNHSRALNVAQHEASRSFISGFSEHFDRHGVRVQLARSRGRDQIQGSPAHMIDIRGYVQSLLLALLHVVIYPKNQACRRSEHYYHDRSRVGLLARLDPSAGFGRGPFVEKLRSGALSNHYL